MKLSELMTVWNEMNKKGLTEISFTDFDDIVSRVSGVEDDIPRKPSVPVGARNG